MHLNSFMCRLSCGLSLACLVWAVSATPAASAAPLEPAAGGNEKDSVPAWVKRDLPEWVMPYVGKRGLPRLAEGTVSLAFAGGAVIAPEVKGAADQAVREVKFAPSDGPRITVVEWGAGHFNSVGMNIQGVTLYSPDPAYVLQGSFD